MRELTLRELCEKEGVSRRAVQGYEALGLVSSSRKNKMGHLLYDEKAVRRVHEIRQLQAVGFSLKEIQTLLDAPAHVRLDALRQKAVELEIAYHEADERLHRIEQMIHRAADEAYGDKRGIMETEIQG